MKNNILFIIVLIIISYSVSSSSAEVKLPLGESMRARADVGCTLKREIVKTAEQIENKKREHKKNSSAKIFDVQKI